LKIIKNPAKYVPQALNLAIAESKGDVIVRMDAHSGYPNDYISRLVRALDQYEADNTGGVWKTLPGGESKEAKAIALATSHPLGIGNADYRLGVHEPTEVDTVPYGCFRRDVFDRFGLFDEHMIRNQDDEMNARIVMGGGKIILLPDLLIEYHARESISKMATMFYQYGLFKPLVNLKVGKPATLRQFAPPTLVVVAILGLTAFLIGFIPSTLMLVFMAFYLIPIVFVSANISAKNGWSLFIWLCLCFPIIHFSYGWGYLRGIGRFVFLGKHRTPGTRSVRDNR
jgi:glycosyltransferase involved in cell wall biosynthesis